MYDLQSLAWNANEAARLLATAKDGDSLEAADRQWYATAGLGYAQLVTAQMLAADLGRDATTDDNGGPSPLLVAVRAVATPPRPPTPVIYTYRLWEADAGGLYVTREDGDLEQLEVYRWREPARDVAEPLDGSEYDATFGGDVFLWDEEGETPAPPLVLSAPNAAALLEQLRLVAEYREGKVTRQAEPRHAAGLNYLRCGDDKREPWVDREVCGRVIPVAVSWARDATPAHEEMLQRRQVATRTLVRIDSYGSHIDAWEAVNVDDLDERPPGQWIIPRTLDIAPDGTSGYVYELHQSASSPLVGRPNGIILVRHHGRPDCDAAETWEWLREIPTRSFAGDADTWDAGMWEPSRQEGLSPLMTVPARDGDPDPGLEIVGATLVASWTPTTNQTTPARARLVVPREQLRPEVAAYLGAEVDDEPAAAPAGWASVEPGPEQVPAVPEQAHGNGCPGTCTGECRDV